MHVSRNTTMQHVDMVARLLAKLQNCRMKEPKTPRSRQNLNGKDTAGNLAYLVQFLMFHPLSFLRCSFPPLLAYSPLAFGDIMELSVSESVEFSHLDIFFFS